MTCDKDKSGTIDFEEFKLALLGWSFAIHRWLNNTYNPICSVKLTIKNEVNPR